MGHEMGHYALNHVVKGVLVLWVLTMAALYGVHRTASFIMAKWQGRLGFSELSDIASLPLIGLLASVFSLVLTPLGLAYSRHLEHEADRFGLELTHYNHAAAMGFVRLQQENLSVPRPGRLFTLFRGTHPSNGDRIDFFNSYRPWDHGEPSRYKKYFAPAPGSGE
jgi:Zn-dependent protease with chaperone function